MSATETTELVTAPANGAAKEVAPPRPQYAQGFDGMATEPFPEAARKVLAEAVNPHDVEIKPDGIVFLPGVAWRRILTRAFGAGGWAIAPRSPARVIGNVVTYHGALYCLGRFVAEAVGECFYRDNGNMSYASCVEGAKTDALGRCAKDLGYGAEMWDANWRTKWQAQYAFQDQNDRTRDGKAKWKLKNRVSNPHDLMAGAGGVAPEAARPEPIKQRVKEGSDPKAGPVSTTTPPASPADGPEAGDTRLAVDDGTVATDEAYKAIAARLKSLKWKTDYMVIWLRDFFGVEKITQLTERQADAAMLMLSAVVPGKKPSECPAYVTLAAKLSDEGRVRS